MILPTLAEMTAWSADEIQFALKNALPSGWSVSRETDDQFYLNILDAEGAVAWSNASYDERLLLLDAFGWLFIRNVDQKQDGPWAPRKQELTHRIVKADAEAFADPPDLDPEELAAVYSKTPGKPGHGG